MTVPLDDLSGSLFVPFTSPSLKDILGLWIMLTTSSTFKGYWYLVGINAPQSPRICGILEIYHTQLDTFLYILFYGYLFGLKPHFCYLFYRSFNFPVLSVCNLNPCVLPFLVEPLRFHVFVYLFQFREIIVPELIHVKGPDPENLFPLAVEHFDNMDVLLLLDALRLH
ncbi:hypothetical protein CFAM422_001391 [Trichoderma lentiforme]|uniref:Uncharacterized protein n=1 Tax=Trichoderma lentiforme TaxID=1567552 RepID=A0A9P5CIK8_9HYPO|nr:hypothetical protein CFAM422_001391 [Trichoderma lentiforme]